MLNFKEYLQLDERSRETDVRFDQDDIAYLNQFPTHFQQKALAIRYSELLCSALDKQGNIIPSWDDNRTVTIKGRSFNVDTGISKLIDRLSSAGYDLQSACQIGTTLAKSGANILNKWRSRSGDKFEPGISGFRSNWPQKAINHDMWTQIKDAVIEEGQRNLEIVLKRFSKPTQALYINYLYWSQPEKKQELYDGLIQYMEEVSKHPNLPHDLTTKMGRSYYIYNFLVSRMQRGYVPVVRIKSAMKVGLDLKQLYASGMKPERMAKVIESGALDKGAGRPASYQFRNRLKASGIDPAPNNKFVQFQHNLDLDHSQYQRGKGRPKRIQSTDQREPQSPEVLRQAN
jgi:hypothetical protein